MFAAHQEDSTNCANRLTCHEFRAFAWQMGGLIGEATFIDGNRSYTVNVGYDEATRRLFVCKAQTARGPETFEADAKAALKAAFSDKVQRTITRATRRMGFNHA